MVYERELDVPHLTAHFALGATYSPLTIPMSVCWPSVSLSRACIASVSTSAIRAWHREDKTRPMRASALQLDDVRAKRLPLEPAKAAGKSSKHEKSSGSDRSACSIGFASSVSACTDRFLAWRPAGRCVLAEFAAIRI